MGKEHLAFSDSFNEINNHMDQSNGSKLSTPNKRQFKLFKNQVAGHYPMLHNRHTGSIYKPAPEEEINFYRNINELLPTISSFIPRYYGVEHLSQNSFPDYSSNSFTSLNNTDEKLPLSSSSKSWSNHCFDKQKDRIKNMSFLVLEDITHPFEKPCVLDLKIGIRHFAPICDGNKKKNKLRKAYRSTNRILGLRLGGMQIFNNQTKKYEWTDKYKGMKLLPDEFCRKLTKFLMSDGKLRKDVLLNLLNRINELISILKNENRFRWFSCSLLLVYEGKKMTSYQSGSRTPPLLSKQKTSHSSDEDSLDITEQKSDCKSKMLNNSYCENLPFVHTPHNDDAQVSEVVMTSDTDSDNQKKKKIESKSDDDSDDGHESDTVTRFIFKQLHKKQNKQYELNPSRFDLRLIDFSNFVNLNDYLNKENELNYNIKSSKQNNSKSSTVTPTKNKDEKKLKKKLQLQKELDNLNEPDHGILFALESLSRLLNELNTNGKIKSRSIKEWLKFRKDIGYSSKAILPFNDYNFDE